MFERQFEKTSCTGESAWESATSLRLQRRAVVGPGLGEGGQTSVDELLSAARRGAPLALLPAAPPPPALRLVLAVRVDLEALQSGAPAALTCVVARCRGDGGERVELARVEWVWRPAGGRPGGAGCAGGEGCWWEGNVPVGRVELFGAGADGPAQIDLGEWRVGDELRKNVGVQKGGWSKRRGEVRVVKGGRREGGREREGERGKQMEKGEGGTSAYVTLRASASDGWHVYDYVSEGTAVRKHTIYWRLPARISPASDEPLEFVMTSRRLPDCPNGGRLGSGSAASFRPRRASLSLRRLQDGLTGSFRLLAGGGGGGSHLCGVATATIGELLSSSGNESAPVAAVEEAGCRIGDGHGEIEPCASFTVNTVDKEEGKEVLQESKERLSREKEGGTCRMILGGEVQSHLCADHGGCCIFLQSLLHRDPA